MKIGLWGKFDNTGLGTLSWEMFNNIKFDKVLAYRNVSYTGFKERFPGAVFFDSKDQITDEVCREFLNGLDIFVVLEDPRNWNIFKIAREMGVKGVLMPMYEGFPMYDTRIKYIDFYLCPSLLDYDLMPEPKKFLPIPTNRNLVKRRKIKEAKVFVHNGGHGGMYGRNGTSEVLEAMKLVKSDIKMVVRSQQKIAGGNLDPRIELRSGNLRNYWDLYNEGDVIIFPHKFDGVSLPILEAMSAGMPIISQDYYPFNTYLNKDLLIKPERVEKVRFAGNTMEIDMYIPDVKALAEKIDEIANTDVSKYSEENDQLAEKWSWDNLREEYLNTFKQICEQ
jgi:glycosyltransferase involved in cell wall biosynthesis